MKSVSIDTLLDNHNPLVFRFLFLVTVLLGVPQIAYAQEAFPVSELTFESIFAIRGNDSLTIYSILGAGYFRTPRSGQEDSLVSAWLSEHPKATVIPVSLMKPTMQDGSGSMVYIWIVDGDDCLNVHLIRYGAFPSGVMEDHVTVAQHMEKIELPFDDNSEIRRYVADAEYNAFITRVIEAEKIAEKERIGI